jgi:N-acetylmuramoyl-L-alanine amidase
VVIDPGHGGEDLGAQGYGGILEKDVVLDVAFATERVLEKQKIARVRLTRRGDHFVPLSERSAMANTWRADLFISLHTNASPKGKLSGLETYYLDMNGDEASRLLAERENASEALAGENADLQFILSDLVQHAKLDDSIRAGTLIHTALVRTLAKQKAGVKDLGLRKAPFYVLVGAHMPCVLLELLFIDNENDGKLISRKEFRHALAEGIATGVRDYFRETKKLAGK